MKPNELELLAVWTWLRNNHHATFQDFIDAFARAARIFGTAERRGGAA